MAEVFYLIVTFLVTPLVCAGFVLIVFLISAKVSLTLRALIATCVGAFVTLGPGILYKLTEGRESDVDPIIYNGMFVVPAFFFAWLLSWLLAKKTVSNKKRTFE